MILVSVCVTTFNRQQSVIKAIDSVLNQTYKNIELIIVNDASSDSTLEILKSYEKKVKNLKVINISNTPKEWTNKKWALQNAINNSRGDIILQTDGDCVPQMNWVLSMASPFSIS